VCCRFLEQTGSSSNNVGQPTQQAERQREMTCVANSTAPTESAPGLLPALGAGPENGIKSHLDGGGEGEELLAGSGETDTCLMINNHVTGSGETDTCLIINSHVAGKWDRKDVVEGGASSQAPVHHL
jgi:hypothetical protein